MDRHEDDPRLQDVATAEGLTVHDLVGEALDFYVRLPAAARRSLRAMAFPGDAEGIDAAARAAGRGVVQAGMDIARQRGRQAAARAYPDGQIASEQAAERDATRLSREARTAPYPGR